jgi:hypothetical protein
LVRLRDAEVIKIEGADTFFGDLARKVLAIRADSVTHPLTVETAAAEARRLVRDEMDLPELDRFVQGATERARDALERAVYDRSRNPAAPLPPADWIRISRNLFGELRAIVKPIARWAKGAQVAVLQRAVERLRERLTPSQTAMVLDDSYWAFPSLLVLYDVGVTMAATKNWPALFQLLADLRIRTSIGESPYASTDVWVWFRRFIGNTVECPPPRLESGWLLDDFHQSAMSEIPSPALREESFDRFEIAVALACLADEKQHEASPPMAGVAATRTPDPPKMPWGLYCVKVPDDIRYVRGLASDESFLDAYRIAFGKLLKHSAIETTLRQFEVWIQSIKHL